VAATASAVWAKASIVSRIATAICSCPFLQYSRKILF
jgi:hypothetical protein